MYDTFAIHVIFWMVVLQFDPSNTARDLIQNQRVSDLSVARIHSFLFFGLTLPKGIWWSQIERSAVSRRLKLMRRLESHHVVTLNRGLG